MAIQWDLVSLLRQRVQWAHTATKWHIAQLQNGIKLHKRADDVQHRTYLGFSTEICVQKKGEKNDIQTIWLHDISIFIFIIAILGETYLIEGLDFCMHYKWKFTQFTGIGFRGGQPLLQTSLMYIFQTARTITWRQQRILRITFAMTYSTNVAAILWCLAAAWPKSTVFFFEEKQTNKYQLLIIVLKYHLNEKWNMKNENWNKKTDTFQTVNK